MLAAKKAKAAEETKASEEAKLAEDARGLPDVEGLAPAPAEDVWLTQKEVVVSGSDALGCKTKAMDSWFWMRCDGKVKVTGVEVEKGRRATQTKAAAEEGAAKLLTPYVEGTDFRAKIVFEGGERFLKLRWPAGKRPYQAGTLSETR
jgi:hypothetical protein